MKEKSVYQIEMSNFDTEGKWIEYPKEYSIKVTFLYSK